jgi:hypothetical protein
VRVNELPALASVQWLKLAFQAFAKSPFQWMFVGGAMVGFMFISLMIPLIGPLIAMTIQPILFAGMIAVAHSQAQGKLEPAQLYAGFKKNTRQLMGLAAIQFFVNWAVVGLLTVPIAQDLQRRGVSAQTIDPKNQEALVKLGQELVQEWWWLMLIVVVTITIVRGLLWFCTALLIRNEMSLMHALRWSAYACIANYGAMIVYALLLMSILFCLLLLAASPLGVLGLFACFAFVPIMFITEYVGYNAVFRSDTPEVVEAVTP